jgi:Trk-type K+ transport system membrane component
MFKQVNLFYSIVFWISLFGVLAFIIDFGFNPSSDVQKVFNVFYFIVLFIGVGTTFFRYIQDFSKIKQKAFIFDFLTIVFTLILFFIHFTSYVDEGLHPYLSHINLVKVAIIFTFIREFFELNIQFNRTLLNPGQLFIVSFIVIIILGSFFLMLPNATHDGISFLDALFTSTSAVCVTGLIVVDTASYFTSFGQVIIMILIQIGGIGILTFASYFSYFFKGGATYENQLVLSDVTSSKKIGEVFSVLKYIILITFSIEIVSGLLIYSSVDSSLFANDLEHIFFSAFHAVSSFCNAGFSTLTDGLYDSSFRFNYVFQLIVIFTFIFGGLGFPIVANLLKYLKYKIISIFNFSKQSLIHKPWVLNINSRITLITTFSLTIIGSCLFLLSEYDNVLTEHESFFGKLVTSLFGAATPRTAGFNTFDFADLSFSTLMMIFLFMWIGASPSSTGGGIKTSTFAIATLNIFSLAKGKSRIEIFRRKIADISVRRAFAIISLSLVVIGSGIMVISMVEKEMELLDIAFECFSAYSTVGLSLGVTADLSNTSKFVLVIIMFVGRVSMLTIIVALFKKVNYKNYHYPSEEITMN